MKGLLKFFVFLLPSRKTKYLAKKFSTPHKRQEYSYKYDFKNSFEGYIS